MIKVSIIEEIEYQGVDKTSNNEPIYTLPIGSITRTCKVFGVTVYKKIISDKYGISKRAEENYDKSKRGTGFK